MRNTGNRSGRERGNRLPNTRNGKEISRHKVLPAQLIPGIAGALVLILAGCTPAMVHEKGSVNVSFCPGDCEELYVNFSEQRANCAFYDLDSEELMEDLEEDEAEVLVFSENHHGFGQEVYSRGLMHHKFCTYGNKTITGSANPTERGFHINYNNILIIESRTIADNYAQEFKEIRKEGNSETRHKKINLSGTIVENYFCPEDSCEKEIMEELRKANESIRFMTFTFTSNPIGNLLVEQSENIFVEGLMESFGLNRYSEYEKMKEAGIKIAMERTDSILHHKVFIIDNQTVITGSYNPTKSANERNDENVLVIHDKEIAEEYLEEYERLKAKLLKDNPIYEEKVHTNGKSKRRRHS